MTDREMWAWDVYFANIVGIQYHPANKEPYRTLQQCAEIADAMILERTKRCQSSPQAQ